MTSGSPTSANPLWPIPGAAGLTVAQHARRELMAARVLHRLQELTVEARASEYVVGIRTSQPPEVQRLQRRVRAVTQRWAPMWTTEAAAAADAETRINVEHVVPVVVLVERILQGDDVVEVLRQAVLCRVTWEEHKRVLIVAFRLEQREIYEQMLSCELEGLAALGWQRYERVGLRTYPTRVGLNRRSAKRA